MAFQPTATVEQLRRRSQLLHDLRAFFMQRGVWEADVPVLSDATVTDVFLEPIRAQLGESQCYLQTSPEFYLKRLLVAGSGSIYYLGPAFRLDECGRRHRPEFTILEWYRVGYDDCKLRAEVVQLLQSLAPGLQVQSVPYGELFTEQLGLCPYSASSAELEQLAHQKLDLNFDLANKSAWLDLLFSHCIEPTMGEGLTLVYDYPVEQCALARVEKNSQGVRVAKRFEVFWGGVELANGYWELTDAVEQERRFNDDLVIRGQQGLRQPSVDQRLLAALRQGLPSCAGVALGVDRLLMALTGSRDIAEVMPFANR